MLKQDKVCGWCRKTDELVLMGQGGGVHTVCSECGSTGPYLSTNEVGKAYRELLARVARLEGVIRMLISCVEDASVLAFDDELDAARAALEAK